MEWQRCVAEMIDFTSKSDFKFLIIIMIIIIISISIALLSIQRASQT